MQRDEALRILGLPQGATDKEIKLAYKECAQILHPDKYASDPKLQHRATEQFKTLQEAYDTLMNQVTPKTHKTDTPSGETYLTAQEIEDRIAELSYYRKQAVKQRDICIDRSRSVLLVACIGVAVLGVFRRHPLIVSIGSAVVLWAVFQIIKQRRTISEQTKKIKWMDLEKRILLERLSNLT